MTRDLGFGSVERMRASLTERAYRQWIEFYRYEAEERERDRRRRNRRKG